MKWQSSLLLCWILSTIFLRYIVRFHKPKINSSKENLIYGVAASLFIHVFVVTTRTMEHIILTAATISESCNIFHFNLDGNIHGVSQLLVMFQLCFIYFPPNETEFPWPNVWDPNGVEMAPPTPRPTPNPFGPPLAIPVPVPIACPFPADPLPNPAELAPGLKNPPGLENPPGRPPKPSPGRPNSDLLLD